ncbi:MAG: Holliday junction branch migration protein RuvA [Acidimicrobiia bacterium]|nr:Holliday junction branch migration protein RuvA [Acidimicrobiia bacterium]MDH5519738.1 Holliday junction branch migration protein RuvA [Acidimicrobiia bacterium]
MIGTLRGTIVDRDIALDGAATAEFTIEVAGVGYRVMSTPGTLSRLSSENEVMIHIHHHFWEDNQRLFGFLTKDERVAFEALLAAHGVGPALALAVLATHPVPQLARILADDDLAALCEVPGVGKKTAQRLLVELKSTVVLPVLDGVDGHPVGAAVANGAESPLVDVREALISLGYSQSEIRSAIASLGTEVDVDADSGQLLKRALIRLSGV